MKLKDIVVWTSGASGTIKQKVGTIIGVIPKGKSLLSQGFEDLASRSGGPRNHESYVVLADGKEYWPVVAKLQAFKNLTGVVSEKDSKPKQTKKVIKDKTIIGISLDFSGSMRQITRHACDDYNKTIEILNIESIKNNQDTEVTTIACGYAVDVNKFLYNSVKIGSVKTLRHDEYLSYGNTPLWDSIQTLIDKVDSTKEDDDAVLIMVITDGEDYGSRYETSKSISESIRKLQATDKWTFTFRVPRGYKKSLVNLGIPDQNIIEWEQTAAGVEKATSVHTSALSGYMTSRGMGATSSNTFYANLNASDSTIQHSLHDISGDLRILPVGKDTPIRKFIEYHGADYSKGNAYYQLTKTEDIVQDYKEILVQDKRDGKIYGGRDSRNLLNLPHVGNIKLKPGKTGFYDIFIQSTSVNRKLLAGTKCLYKSI